MPSNFPPIFTSVPGRPREQRLLSTHLSATYHTARQFLETKTQIAYAWGIHDSRSINSAGLALIGGVFGEHKVTIITCNTEWTQALELLNETKIPVSMILCDMPNSSGILEE